MTRPHLIYIAFFFPPSRASGVYRAIATCNAFIARGWDVTVITCNQEFFEDEIGSTDVSLIDSVDPSVEVVRVGFSFDTNRKKFEDIGFLEANFPEVFSKARNRFRKVINFQRLLGGRSPSSHQINDRYSTWIDPVVNAGIKASRKGTSHILATGNPFSSFVAARWLGMALGIDYSIDFRDPWSFNVFTSRRLQYHPGIHPVESDVVQAARFCFHVNHAIAESYKSAYPDFASKQRVALNGYEQDLDGAIDLTNQFTEADNDGVVFGILGTVNDRWPLEEIFSAWQTFKEEFGGRCEFKLAGHLGYFATSEEAIRDLLPLEADGFEYVGPVQKNKVRDFYADIDILILPIPGGKMVTSGKVFEAGVIGKPIICVQTKGGGARELLASHPLSFGAEPSSESIVSAMRLAVEQRLLMDGSVFDQVMQWAKPYERQVAISALVDAICTENSQ